MDLMIQPHITTMDKSSEASAFIAVLLAFFGLSDLTAASLDDLPALEYWLANVPVRLAVLFAVTAYSYLFKEDGMLGEAQGAGRFLCNSFVFAWGFLELMIWFWVSMICLGLRRMTQADQLEQIFVSLKEERRVVAQKIIDARKAEEDTL